MTDLRPVTDQASVLLAPNPGPMTLDGTNSYVLRGDPVPTGPCVVVDPGPDDEGHLAALAGAGEVALILITHQHTDHTAGSARLHRMTGAPVRAPRPADCHGGPALQPGEVLTDAGCRIVVISTPGHTADSVCFHVPGDGPDGSVLTGDTVLGAGTTVIGIPDGTLAQYLDSLDRIAGLGASRGLPAHGPQIADLPAVCAQYRAHREQRLAEVSAALDRLGLPPGPEAVGPVTDAVYRDVDPGVRFAAEHSMAAQLAYLRQASG